MAGLRYVYRLFVILEYLSVVLVLAQNPVEEKTTFEAAFQGRCGHGSPCEQLCYELHDGMYECDCKDGYILHKNGYSCAELNSTSPSTSELGELIDEAESDEANADNADDEDAVEDILYMRGATFTIHLDAPAENSTADATKINEGNGADRIELRATSQGPNLEQKLPSTMESIVSTEPACSLDCGPAGNCYIEQSRGDEVDVVIEDDEDGIVDLEGNTVNLRRKQGTFRQRCQCPLGRGGDRCQLGEFDCGSGVGTVRSTETVKLNEWNTLSVYRHRWDAWIQLNQEKRVEGRSKGLFSRITFREPLFVGGPGNTTGLERLPVRTGFKGCIRHLEANEHHYRFPLAPQGDAANGFDVEECTADRCSKVPCSHGGKCLTTGGDTAVCLCPLGYTGDLCETRVDLQVPSFNGSSYLRYPGLADTSLSWLELSVTLKPTAPDGVILYNGHHSDATGDFIALYLSSGHVQFTFDLGTGPATLRSENPVRLGEWVEVRVSRTGRLASLEVEEDPAQEILAPGAFTQLSLPLNLYLGGAPSSDMYSPKMKTTASFVGCIQTIVLNNREMGILAEALGGVNVGNCGHACEARPCGDAECRPLRERFTCRCRPGVPHPCPAPDDYTRLVPPPARVSSNNAVTSVRYERAVPSFTGSESYLHYNDADTMKRIISYRVDINMRFRVSSSSGLLLWSGRQSDSQEQRDENDDFLALGLDHGYLTLAYNLGSGEAVLRYNLTRLDDDLWHRIRAVRNEQWASLVVDSGTGVSASSPGQLRQLNTDTGLYVGGAPDIVRTTGGRYAKGIVGCISDLVLDSDFSVALSSPAQATNTHSCIP
ncbi:hypothetical protein ACFW04_000181 [Cataglyphis niger]